MVRRHHDSIYSDFVYFLYDYLYIRYPFSDFFGKSQDKGISGSYMSTLWTEHRNDFYVLFKLFGIFGIRNCSSFNSIFHNC